MESAAEVVQGECGRGSCPDPTCHVLVGFNDFEGGFTEGAVRCSLPAELHGSAEQSSCRHDSVATDESVL